MNNDNLQTVVYERGVGLLGSLLAVLFCNWLSIGLQLSPTFKGVVLRGHEEFSGLSQHYTIRICMSNDSPGDFGAFAHLYTDQRPDTTICCVFFAEMKQGRKSFCGCAELACGSHLTNVGHR